MLRVVRVMAAFTLVFVSLSPVCGADSLQLSIRDGRVTLVAADVTIGRIFEEWARVGRTRIVNGDRVPGGRVTLQLANVSEREALDLLLRAAAGYIAVPRTTPPCGSSMRQFASDWYKWGSHSMTRRAVWTLFTSRRSRL